MTGDSVEEAQPYTKWKSQRVWETGSGVGPGSGQKGKKRAVTLGSQGLASHDMEAEPAVRA